MLATALWAVFSCSSPADAANLTCTDRDSLLRRLEAAWGETPVSQGVTSDGVLVELLASEGGATWTLLLTLPSGVSCLWAAGDGWQRITPARRGQPS